MARRSKGGGGSHIFLVVWVGATFILTDFEFRLLPAVILGFPLAIAVLFNLSVATTISRTMIRYLDEVSFNRSAHDSKSRNSKENHVGLKTSDDGVERIEQSVKQQNTNKEVPSQRNLTIRRMQTALDFIAVALLLNLLTVDILPTIIIVVGLIVWSLWIANEKSTSHPNSTIKTDNLSLRAHERSTVTFKRAPREVQDAHVFTTLFSSFVFVPDHIENSTDEKKMRAILEHEIAHVRRRDTITTLIFDKISRHLIQVLVFFIAVFPIFLLFAVFFFDFALSLIFLAPVVMAFFYGPAIYLYINRRDYLHRREFMADAEAADIMGVEYINSFERLKRRQSFIVDKTEYQKTKSRPSSQRHFESYTHPSLDARLRALKGELEEPRSTIFYIAFMCVFLGIFALMGLGVGLTYAPHIGGQSEFNLGKSIVSVLLFAAWIFYVAKISRAVFSLRNNGLDLRDRLYGVSGFLAAILVFLLTVLSVTVATSGLDLFQVDGAFRNVIIGYSAALVLPFVGLALSQAMGSLVSEDGNVKLLSALIFGPVGYFFAQAYASLDQFLGGVEIRLIILSLVIIVGLCLVLMLLDAFLEVIKRYVPIRSSMGRELLVIAILFVFVFGYLYVDRQYVQPGRAKEWSDKVVSSVTRSNLAELRNILPAETNQEEIWKFMSLSQGLLVGQSCGDDFSAFNPPIQNWVIHRVGERDEYSGNVPDRSVEYICPILSDDALGLKFVTVFCSVDARKVCGISAYRMIKP